MLFYMKQTISPRIFLLISKFLLLKKDKKYYLVKLY